MSATHFPLCDADDGTFWPWLSWTAFRDWPDRGGTVVVLPLAGLADWGLGHPLDAEETVLMRVLREASRMRPAQLRLLVAPPLRFAFGPDPGCAFGVDPPVAHALIAEVASSIAAAGFRRIVLLNASPWSEEICAAASRDLRLALDLKVFRIHLSALGLDFHPARSRDRRRLQTLLTAVTGRIAEAGPAAQEAVTAGWGCEPVNPLPGAPASLEEARSQAPSILSAAAGRLVSLLGEIQTHEWLRNPDREVEPQ